jgi:hypothetical protein
MAHHYHNLKKIKMCKYARTFSSYHLSAIDPGLQAGEKALTITIYAHRSILLRLLSRVTRHPRGKPFSTATGGIAYLRPQ